MKNALTPLAKRVLIPIGLSAGMSALDASIQNKNLWMGSSVGLSFAYNGINNFK